MITDPHCGADFDEKDADEVALGEGGTGGSGEEDADDLDRLQPS
jgi:hypothetical protein